MLACVNLSSAAVSVLYFAGILAGSFKCLVGLALEILVLFPARTALRVTSVLIRKYFFPHSLCPSCRPPMYVLLAQCHSAASQQLQRGSAYSSAVQMKDLTEVDFLEK